MQNNIQIFENSEFGQIRIATDSSGLPWWVLKDLCRVLGIENPSYVRNRLDDDEVGSFNLPHPQNLDKSLKMTCVRESGMYAVILRSDKPNAKMFRKWITSEVLPSIRKHGAYIHEDILEQMRESSEFAEQLLRRLSQEQAKVDTLIVRLNEATPKVRYHDIVLRCTEAIQPSIIAKDYGLSGVAFNRLLQRLKVQFRIGKTWVLYEKYQGNGYTVTNTYSKNGVVAWVHTCYTQRGRLFLYELLKSHGILPEIEKMGA